MRPIKPLPAPPKRRALLVSDLETENRQLRDELYYARQALIDLLDPQELLSGYWGCDDSDQVDEWRLKTAAAVIDAARVRPGKEMGYPRSPRAICPLCRQGAVTVSGVQGFAVPTGLRRHLLGEYNARQCPVFKAAEELAWGRVRRLNGD